MVAPISSNCTRRGRRAGRHGHVRVATTPPPTLSMLEGVLLLLLLVRPGHEGCARRGARPAARINNKRGSGGHGGG